MQNKPLIDQQLANRFKQLDQSPRNGNGKIDPLVFAHFIKNSVSYYAIAHDEKRNEILCFVSNAKDINKPEWISIEKLEEKSLLGLGKGAVRDYSFSETNHSNLKIEPYRNTIEEYYIEYKKDIEENEQREKERLEAEEKMSHPLTQEQVLSAEQITNDHLLNEFELLRIEEQDNAAALTYEEQEREDAFTHNTDLENENEVTR